MGLFRRGSPSPPLSRNKLELGGVSVPLLPRKGKKDDEKRGSGLNKWMKNQGGGISLRPRIENSNNTSIFGNTMRR